MRISIPIGSRGERWHPSLPRVNLERCYPLNAGFDETEFRRQVRGCDRINMSSEDCGAPCAFAAILLASLNDWMRDNDKASCIDDIDKVASRIIAREERNNVSFCTIGISHAVVETNGKAYRGVRVDIRHDDRGTPQNHEWDYEFSLVAADFVREYSRRAVERGEPPIKFSERTQKLVEKLDEIRKEEEAVKSNENRVKCPNYRCGLCSPFNPSCAHYKDGNCVDIKTEAGHV